MKQYREMDAIAKTIYEKFVTFGVFALVIGTYAYEVKVILPRLYGEDYTIFIKLFHIILGSIILFNLLASMLKFITLETGVGDKTLPTSLLPGWRRCKKCRANFPPRSYHCYFCGLCVLVRDHHSTFGGTCVAYSNRRYFMLMLFYGWIGLLYANILNMSCMMELYNSLQYKSVVALFIPLPFVFSEPTQVDAMSLSLYSEYCALFLIYVSILLWFHTNNTLQGRTSIEVTKEFGFEFNVDREENLKEAFGNKWRIGWITPLIDSPLPGNGFHFKKPKDYIPEEDTKDF